MTILGGIGTLSGSILGAALMHILSQFFYQWFGARWPLVFGIIFILIVLFLPYGIVGMYRIKNMILKVAGIDLLSCLNQTADNLGLKMEP